MAYGGSVGRGVATSVGAVVAIAVSGGCTVEDCVNPGPSVVELRLTPGVWNLSEFCVDSECLTPPDGPIEAGGEFYSLHIPVADHVASYHYRVMGATPEGVPFAREGEIKTAGNTGGGGEGCRPKMFTASLTVAHDGKVTSQSP
jgi:hypothetical protein